MKNDKVTVEMLRLLLKCLEKLLLIPFGMEMQFLEKIILIGILTQGIVV